MWQDKSDSVLIFYVNFHRRIVRLTMAHVKLEGSESLLCLF